MSEQPDTPIDQLDPEERLFRMRHSAAHVLAEAMLQIFPDAKYANGPPTEHGFHSDFALPPTPTPWQRAQTSPGAARGSATSIRRPRPASVGVTTTALTP